VNNSAILRWPAGAQEPNNDAVDRFYRQDPKLGSSSTMRRAAAEFYLYRAMGRIGWSNFLTTMEAELTRQCVGVRGGGNRAARRLCGLHAVGKLHPQRVDKRVLDLIDAWYRKYESYCVGTHPDQDI
jgi:hypothetical protein